MSISMAQSLLLEVHSHLAAVIEPGNKPHPDSFPLHIFTAWNSTIYFHSTLPPSHRKNSHKFNLYWHIKLQGQETPVTYQLWLYGSTLSHATVCMNALFCCDMTPHHLVNKANLVYNLFLVYVSISTCFGGLCAHHQEKQLCLCNTWYLLFCVDDCLVCRMEWRSIETFHPAYQAAIHTE
jgi:hypothetical protein